MNVRSRATSLRQLISSETTLFIVGVLLAASSGFLVCSDLVRAQRATLQIAGAVTVIVWMALCIPERRSKAIMKTWLISALLFSPIAFTALATNTGARDGIFIVILFVWAAALAVSSLFTAKGDAWDRLVTIAFALSGFFSAIVFIGQFPYFFDVQDLFTHLPAIGAILDIRLFMMILLTTLVFASSVFRAFREERPVIGDLRAWQIKAPGNGNDFFSLLVIPFVVLLNSLLFLLLLLLNVGRILCIYLMRFGRYMFMIIRDVLLNYDFLRSLIKFTMFFILQLILAQLVVLGVEPLGSYLRSNDWLLMLEYFVSLIAVAALMELCIAGCVWILEENLRTAAELSASALAILLAIFLMSGMMLHGLARVHERGIVGFEIVGPFSVALMMLVLTGVVKIMMRRRS